MIGRGIGSRRGVAPPPSGGGDRTALVPPQGSRPRECLHIWSQQVQAAFVEATLPSPSKQDVLDALNQYHMFSEAKLAEYEQELD